MNTIPPLVIEQAREIKDLPYERLVVFNSHCTKVLISQNGNATGVPVPVSMRSQIYKKPSLHNHPLMKTSLGLFTSCIPSVGDIIGANYYLSPHLYVCDRDKITKTIMPKELNEKKLGRLHYWMCFGYSFEHNPYITVKEIVDLLYDIEIQVQLFDINTLERSYDFMTGRFYD